VLLGEEALEVLVDEKEAGKFRIGERHHDEPRRRDREEQQAPANQVQSRQQLPVTLEQNIGSHRADGQHHAGQALVRTASAAAAQATSIQRRRPASSGSRCASAKANTEADMKKLSAISRVRRWPTMA